MKEELIQDLLKNRIGVLSTVREDGTPCVAPVHFAHVGDQIVWLSSKSAAHSQNIARDGRAAFVTWNHVNPGEAVYVHSTARAVEGDEATTLLEAYEQTLGNYPETLRGTTLYAMPVGEIDDNSTTQNWVHMVA